MSKNEIITDMYGNEHILIDQGNGEYTSMLKSTYDEQQAQAEHFRPMVTDAPKS